MRNFALALVGAVVSIVYWGLVMTIAYGLVAGDPGPVVPRVPVVTQNATTIAVVVAALIVHALGTVLWRRIEARLRR